jgi:hypothetical protein
MHKALGSFLSTTGKKRKKDKKKKVAKIVWRGFLYPPPNFP